MCRSLEEAEGPARTVDGKVTWQQRVEQLAPKERDVLLGTSLSRRFTALPLWLNHPANIGAFYGFLVALALVLPYAFGPKHHDVWAVEWVYHTSLLMVACWVLGMASLLLVNIAKRHPVTPPRTFLYPMPFVGLTLLSIDRIELAVLPPALVWLFLLLPGPVYVHLSWAPRYRLLCMLEDGLDPFEGMASEEASAAEEAEHLAGSDTELLEVVDAFEAE